MSDGITGCLEITGSPSSPEGGILPGIPGGGVPPGSPDTDTTEKNKTRKHNRDSSTWKLVRL